MPDPAAEPSRILLFTGDGKGKTTAAMGLVVRAWAQGWTVGVMQFVKSSEWRYGERPLGEQLGLDWWLFGDGCVNPHTDLDRSALLAQQGWEQAKVALASGAHRLLVLDEITLPLSFAWLDADEVAAAVAGKHTATTVALTGRDAPQQLIDIADTVSDVREVKHAYRSGILAQAGIEY